MAFLWPREITFFTFFTFLLRIYFTFLCSTWISHTEFHCVKRVRIRSYSGPHFSRIFSHLDWIQRDSISPYSVRMRENPGKMRTRITPNTDSFYALFFIVINKRKLSNQPPGYSYANKHYISSQYVFDKR